MSIRQWDTDWFDQFKTQLATNLTTLNIYPGQPLWWCERRDIAYGQKQIQPQIRRPDQRVHISREVEYDDKYADRIIQVADLPSITDSLRIEREYYYGDPVNALGHVADLGTNYKDGLAQFVIVGTSIDPLAYGIIDAGAGTGSTSVTRPDIVDAVTTSGEWDTPAQLMETLSEMETALEGQGFHGTKVVASHPLIKPFLKGYALTGTAVNELSYINTAFGYAWDLCEYYDADATKDVVDLYMIDTGSFTIYQTPVRMASFYNEETEHIYWRWSTRAIPLSKPMHNGTDWKKGIVKCTVDIHD